MKNKQRHFRMAVKSLSEDGSFEGCLSPYKNTDDGGDCVEPGAYTKTLQENGNKVPMLWQHKTDCPIGELILEDRADGLYCRGQLLLDIAEAKKAYLLLKAGILKGLSIGYEAIKAQVVNGVRHLKEIRLYEGSVVTFPMNALALVSDVKSHAEKGDFSEELTDIQLRAALDQIMYALGSALCELPWSGLSRADILSGAETVIQQFQDTYLDYLPNYLDYLAREYGMDTKSWTVRREQKAGRKLSFATRDTLKQACDHAKNANDILTALLSEEAGDPDEDATSENAAAVDHKSEPETHSAVKSLKSMRALLAQA